MIPSQLVDPIKLSYKLGELAYRMHSTLFDLEQLVSNINEEDKKKYNNVLKSLESTYSTLDLQEFMHDLYFE